LRKLNTAEFTVAGRATSRQINRGIALNLIRVHQPISRADLARRMNTTRGAVGLLVDELIEGGLIYQGATGSAPRGRRPVFLFVRTNDRLAAAADIRASRIDVMLADFSGRRLALETLDPAYDPGEFIKRFARWYRTAIKENRSAGTCEGIGVVVPGMVDRNSGRVINAPLLGWRDVEIRSPLAKAVGMPVFVESAGRACALAQMWLSSDNAPETHNFVYVSVSDGVGTGLVIGGELVRGHNQIAGEFGHMPIRPDGPPCACGAVGCWMASVSNLATVARYAGVDNGRHGGLTVMDIIRLARGGDRKAAASLHETARYLGLGLVTLIHGVDPACIYIGGEITAAWDLLEPVIRSILRERSLSGEEIRTPIAPSTLEYPRLRGAAALVSAPMFAVPGLA
jgi:predicted NBD/HSP70 family sugar kinase